IAFLIGAGFDHELVAGFVNSKRCNIEQKPYRAKASKGVKASNTDEINLDNEFGLTEDGQPFVLFDSKDNDRIIGFCSPIGLEILSKAKRLHSDGTFKCTPRLYYQTFCIHVWFLEQMFPCLFVLLKEKSESIYRKMLTLLKEACFERGIVLNPDTLVTDFEIASIKAFRFHFTSIKVLGFYFNYAQSIRRNVDILGLKIPYSSNDEIQFLIKSSIALSVVDVVVMKSSYLQRILM
ncbi:unnamed protein product, partial [Brachionus calyciflorus]